LNVKLSFGNSCPHLTFGKPWRIAKGTGFQGYYLAEKNQQLDNFYQLEHH
jgi:hypothetical protein